MKIEVITKWIRHYDGYLGMVRPKPLTFELWNLPQGRADYRITPFDLRAFGL